MFKHILVPLDGSPAAAAALPLAESLARARAGELILLRVSPYQYQGAAQTAEARDYLAVMVAGLAARGVRARPALSDGEVAEAIVDEARGAPADLIVMTTHGRHGVARAVYGSVAERVLASSPVPVLLLRADEAPITRLKTLLVPLDSDPGGAAALALARDLAVQLRSRIVLLRVLPLPDLSMEAASDPPLDEARQDARRLLDGLSRRLIAHGVLAQSHIAIGPVAESIVATARELRADLIVMDTRALTGARRALRGSVADTVVRTATQPVLLIRRGTRERPDDLLADAPTGAPRGRSTLSG